MKICYVDESRDLGALPSPTSPIQPVLVVTGLFVDRDSLSDMTREFLELKTKRFPRTFASSRVTTWTES